MKRVGEILGLLAGLLAVSACGKPDNASGPGGVTVGEAKALDQAAEMLDRRRPPEEALPPSTGLPALESTEAPR
jgi:hypothetical protein